MAHIIPAIIPEDFQDLLTHLSQIRRSVSTVQIDVLDGVYDDDISWPYNRRDVHAFENIVRGDEGLPFWEYLNFEIDMMVAKPEEKIDDWIDAGAATLIVHVESTTLLSDIFAKGKERGVAIALALKPSTDIAVLVPWIEQVSFVQCMGSDNIGEHGVELDPKVLGKIEDMKKEYKGVTIGVDIGVTLDTVPKLLRAGATRFAAGSAIFKSDTEPSEAIKAFEAL